MRRRVSGEDTAASADRAAQGRDPDRLDEDALLQALGRGDRAQVREALVLRSGVDETTVERILTAGSAKGVTALAWKAGLAMRVAVQLQSHGRHPAA